MSKKGILLINLGTPEHHEPASVYRFLKEFLNDPRVIDIPPLLRWLLVNGIIIPWRYKKSAAAYQQIWLASGSPLLVYSQELTKKLANELGKDYQVALGMRYGKPNIEMALNQLSDCHQIVVLPLFPQYSSAATGSAIEKALSVLSKRWNMPEIFIKRDFYNEAGFIQAYAEVIKKNMGSQLIELLLFSYHGLPERHIHKSQCKAQCDRHSECPVIHDDSQFCYRAQCYETSRLIANALGLEENRYQVAFQSRLGRTPWIKPYTDLLLPQLIQQGIRHIAIVCPSFVSDCLETLEEINIRAREQWRQLGGKTFISIPCLNAHEGWTKTLADWVRKIGLLR